MMDNAQIETVTLQLAAWSISPEKIEWLENKQGVKISGITMIQMHDVLTILKPWVETSGDVKLNNGLYDVVYKFKTRE